jgi:hypothetical protein
VGPACLRGTIQLAMSKGLTIDERFVVDGTLIKAFAGVMNFKKVVITLFHSNPRLSLVKLSSFG